MRPQALPVLDKPARAAPGGSGDVGQGRHPASSNAGLAGLIGFNSDERQRPIAPASEVSELPRAKKTRNQAGDLSDKRSSTTDLGLERFH
jgi:hypothetical protein